MRQFWFDRLRRSPLPCLGSERCSYRGSSARAPEARMVRQRAGDRALRRVGTTSIWVSFSPAREPRRPLWWRAAAFDRLGDDEGMPLICPTCQVLLQAFMPPAAGYFAWVVFDI